MPSSPPLPAPPANGAPVRRNVALGLLMALAVLAADQIAKELVEAHLPFQEPVAVMPFFSLYYTFNTGIAFSFMNGLSPPALLAIACGVVGMMLFLWWQAREDGLLPALGYGLILGGALGNILDRAEHGHVIDYVLLYAGSYSFAIFNLADAALTVGVGFILCASLVAKRNGPQL